MLRKGYANMPYKQGLNILPNGINPPISRHFLIGVILILALLAFEIFNFDSTRYALNNLLGGAAFLGLTWATILATAFCAIDFAGLAHLFTPQRGKTPNELWYLMGAWLLGATMNAIMTWWAVSLALLNHDFGNEILNRQQLLTYVPIFVAILVWLTRILFIGAFSVAGDHFFRPEAKTSVRSATPAAKTPSNSYNNRRAPAMATSAPPSRPLNASPKREPAGYSAHSRPGSYRNRGARPGLQATPRNNS